MPTTKHLLNTLLLLAVPLAGCSTLHGNFQTVEEGLFYRSGQLHGAGLSRRLEKHTIRAVVSLRDPDQGESWYVAEISACESLGVEHFDVPWSKEALPSPESLVRLIDIFDSTEGPLLVHCQGGVHRSAVASAVYFLTCSNSNLPNSSKRFLASNHSRRLSAGGTGSDKPCSFQNNFMQLSQ